MKAFLTWPRNVGGAGTPEASNSHDTLFGVHACNLLLKKLSYATHSLYLTGRLVKPMRQSIYLYVSTDARDEHKSYCLFGSH